MRSLNLLGLILVAAWSPLSAQRLEEARVAASGVAAEALQLDPPVLGVASRTSASTGAMITGGVIGGLLGAFGGASAGVTAENCDRKPQDDFCGLAGAVLGAVLGEAIGVPIGVNYAANGRGTLSRTIPASLALTAACLFMAYPTSGISVAALPIMQIFTSIRAERTGKAGVIGM